MEDNLDLSVQVPLFSNHSLQSATSISDPFTEANPWTQDKQYTVADKLI